MQVFFCTLRQGAILDIKAFLKAGRESADVALATERRVKSSKDPKDTSYSIFRTAVSSLALGMPSSPVSSTIVDVWHC